MSESRLTPLVATLALVVAGFVPVCLAQEVGKLAVAQRDVKSLKPGASDPVPAVAGASIVLNEKEITGRASRAKFLFGEGAVVSIGQNTTFEVSQGAVDQATGKATTKVDMAEGKLRVFVSRFWGGRPKVEVDTPTAVVGIKGSEVLIEVFDGKTTVTVFGGSAEVRSKTGGATTTVTASQQVDVTSAGAVGSPIVLNPPVLVTLWNLTEPIPEPPVELPKSLPIRPVPDSLLTTTLVGTDCITCSGTTTIADPPITATRDVPSVPGEPINSGTKAGRR